MNNANLTTHKNCAIKNITGGADIPTAIEARFYGFGLPPVNGSAGFLLGGNKIKGGMKNETYRNHNIIKSRLYQIRNY